MPRAILALNAGSSSVKFALFGLRGVGIGRRLCSGQVDCLGRNARLLVRSASGEMRHSAALSRRDAQHAAAIRAILDWLNSEHPRLRLVAAGHRVVQGGTEFADPVLVKARVMAELRKLIPLAPLHQPQSLAGIRAINESYPRLPQVACFDTAFHRTQPEVATRFALPERFYARGIRRFGFHGLSYESVVRRLPRFLGRRAYGRVIVAHLGNGASLCALRSGRSVATTMGFTPLDGLMMGTRPGNLDPGVVLYLMREQAYTEAKLTRLLFHECGLLGVSGISNDLRDLIASNRACAKRAIELYTYRLVREIGALVVILGGLDALVFTGGIGQHSPLIRRMACGHLGWLGVRLESKANECNQHRISRKDSPVAVCLVPADEEAGIARHTAAVVGKLHLPSVRGS